MDCLEVMKTIAKSPTSQQICCRVLDDPLVQEAVECLKRYDRYTLEHSLRVASYAVNLGNTYFMDKDELFEIGKAGLLHDIGKIYIRQDIVQKPGKLTQGEYTTVKQHVLLSCMWLSLHGVSTKIVRAVSEHHERKDGSGYPYGIKGSELTLYGRILAVADIYDAVTVKRVYQKSAMTAEEALSLLSEGESVDPNVVNVLDGLV